MSAINTFAFQNFLCSPRTSRACLCMFAEETVHVHHEPAVTARWSLETSSDGSRRLVRHWFKNVPAETTASRRSSR